MKPTGNTLPEVKPNPANATRNRCRKNAQIPLVQVPTSNPRSQLPGSGWGRVPLGSRAQVIVVSFTSSEGWDGMAAREGIHGSPLQQRTPAQPDCGLCWCWLSPRGTHRGLVPALHPPAAHVRSWVPQGLQGDAERRAPRKAESEGMPLSSDPFTKLLRPAQATRTNCPNTGTTGTCSVTGLVPSSQRRHRRARVGTVAWDRVSSPTAGPKPGPGGRSGSGMCLPLPSQPCLPTQRARKLLMID